MQRQRTTQKREIRDKERKRTVGPALATMSTVSPLGTALTVPRSHPVTGMTRADERCVSSRFEVLFCEEIWEEMASGFVTSFKNTTHIFRSTTRTYLRVLSCDVHIINTRERKASVRSKYLGSTRESAVGGETGVFVTSIRARATFFAPRYRVLKESLNGVRLERKVVVSSLLGPRRCCDVRDYFPGDAS